MTKTHNFLWMTLVLLAWAVSAQAQTVAVDDADSVPYNTPLVVEAPGVLDNDTYNGDPASDHGATAELLVWPAYGSLSCEGQPAFDLCPDGSFTYTPFASFPGFDTFVYQANVGGDVSQATMTLSACSGGTGSFVCWKEAPYLAKLGELGYSLFQEGFEDDATWGAVRSPFSAPFVISQGVRWESNFPQVPPGNEITTGSGPARTGQWGVYDPDHGYATGTTAQCDVTNPPEECLYHDGFTGTREPGERTLYGVGGYFTGVNQPNMRIILDGGAPIGLGRVFVGEHQFFGVIEAAGFDSFRFEETDGKIGQTRLVFGDDFTLGTTPSDNTSPRVSRIGSFADTGDGELTEGEVTANPITQLLVTFDELVSDLEYTETNSASNPANYLLFSDGGDGFDTVDCSTGVDAGDVGVTVDWVTYLSGSELTSTLDVNGGIALPPASYRLLVCGTTSIQDWSGNALDGDGNGMGGDDFERNFTVIGNTVPVAMDDAYSTGQGMVLDVSPPGVLVNDVDSDGDTLMSLPYSDPSNGSLTLNTDGSLHYAPYPTFFGEDSFGYRAFDGQDLSNVATVTLTVAPSPGDVVDSLRVDRSTSTPGNIVLTWGPSCSTGASDYAIFEGTIGDYPSHIALQCTDFNGDMTEEITPQVNNGYYLLVPLTSTAEGSYGRDSNGVERPVPRNVDRCANTQITGTCP
jgi:hypothetical protein